MKRLSFCLAILLLLSFGLAQATSLSVKTSDIEGAVVGADTLFLGGSGGVVKFPIVYTNDSGNSFNPSNGFKVYSPDGAGWGFTSANGGNFKTLPATQFGLWVDTVGAAAGGIGKDQFGAVYKFNLFGADGLGNDTVIFAGAANDVSQTAVGAGFNHAFFKILLNLKTSDSGKHICIDSTTLFPPSNPWKWASFNFTPSYSVVPLWSGPYCYVIAKIRNQKPTITNCPPTGVSGSHCGSFTYSFTATDPEQNAIVWNLVSGVGSIDANTGVWSANGLATGIYTVVVGATDPAGSGQTTTCTFTVTATNVGPTITCPATKSVSTGEIAKDTIKATDDCDTKTFFIVSSTATGATIDPVTGILTYMGDVNDIPNNPVCAVVGVTDGVDTATCNACFTVIKGCKYKVKIQAQVGGGSGVIQGTMTTVDVTLEGADQVAGLGGFNLLIAYDNSALSFQSAAEGSIYGTCKWEYFTYRFGADGNCSGGCPSGLIRVVGIAETNNGTPHAICPPDPLPIGATLAQLSFLVSNNRTLECQVVPIRFFWVECGDNTLSSADGSKLYVSCSVKDLFGDPITTPETALPSYMGAPDFCVTSTQKAFVKREVDFVNGYVKIICGKDIDARGDVNLNGLAYEIADAVMFTNYYIVGLTAFAPHIDGSIAATDVNADGLALTVADLVYLIRVIVGDAQPYPKPTSVAVDVTNENGVISINGTDLGAVFMTLKGDVPVSLVANNAVMESAYDNVTGNTRVLVHVPFDINQYGKTVKGFSGDIINANAEIVSIEMADAHGYKLDMALPKAYALNQNYPNPFNPTTTISFDMPKAGAYTITIYNVTGQKVAELAGEAAAGKNIKRTWDASQNASGVYFYKLETAGFSATKKAVLLK